MSGRPLRVVVCVRPFAPEEIEGKGEKILGQLDRAALAEALRVARASGGDVVALSVGPDECEDTLRRFLAAGAHRAVRASAPADATDGVLTGKLLALAVQKLDPDLVLCGNRSIVGLHGLVGHELAETLGWPLSQDVIEIQSVEGRTCRTVQWSERGDRNVVDVRLPAVLTVRESVARPRYLAVAREARHAADPVDVLDVGDLDGLQSAVDDEYGQLTVTVVEPKIRVKKKKTTAPAGKPMTAADRRKALAGGRPRSAPQPAASSTEESSNDPAALAAKVIDFLKEKELL